MKIWPIIFTAVLVAACFPEKDHKDTDNQADTIEIQVDNLARSEKEQRWYADYDAENNTDIIVKGRLLDSSNKTPENLIAILNQGEKTTIVLSHISHDTMFVELHDAEHITEQSGSTGAWWYLAGATFTLTEIDQISYVKYDFEEGSHLSPGVYDRESFHELRIIDRTQ